nr:hypothetical protein [Tanacetum cinerariifolium]
MMNDALRSVVRSSCDEIYLQQVNLDACQCKPIEPTNTVARFLAVPLPQWNRSGGEVEWWWYGWHLRRNGGEWMKEAILHILCILDCGFKVMVEVLVLTKFLYHLISIWEFLGLSTQATSREVDRRKGWVESRVVFMRLFWMGKDSFDEMSMTLVLGIFLGRFLVKELALEAMKMMIKERFMNYLEEQTDGESMINSIKNGDQPLPRVTQLLLAETSSTEQPPLKDKSMWSDQEKKVHKIDRLARSLLIQGLPNDIYSLIDSNKTAKDLWDGLARHMLGSEYGEQDRKVAVLYEYETFKATEGELLLDTYIRYLQWKQCATMMRQNKNLLDVNIDALYNILKQNQGDVNDGMKSKKKAVVITSDPLALVVEQTKPTNNNLRTSSATSLANKKQEYVKFDDKKVDEKKRDMSKVKCYNCKKEGHFAKDCKKANVKDYEYYKTKMLLAKKDKDEQVLLAEDQAWMESSSDLDLEINANMVFMAQIEKVLSDSEASSSSSDDKIAEIVDQEILFDKMSRQLVELDENVQMLKNAILEKDLKIPELGECVRNKDLEIEKCLERLNECENKLHKIRQTNQTIHMIIPSKDTLYNGQKEIGFENPSYFEKANDVRPSLYDEKKKWSSNTSNVDLSSINHSKFNKDVKRYSRKDLLSCNNSYLGETSSAYVCNDAMNVPCNSRLYDSFDENNLFIFDDESVRNSQVSKMPFRKKPNASLNVHSRIKLNKSLPRIVRKWLSKLQPLAEPVDKWIPKIVQICLWIIDSGCSKHMTGNRALLTNFVEKFLRTVRFGNNDFCDDCWLWRCGYWINDDK